MGPKLQFDLLGLFRCKRRAYVIASALRFAAALAKRSAGLTRIGALAWLTKGVLLRAELYLRLKGFSTLASVRRPVLTADSDRSSECDEPLEAALFVGDKGGLFGACKGAHARVMVRA